MYGTFSIETFCNAGGLSYTHEDAEGWYNYVAQFAPPNFWYKDGGVRPWAYYEDYDNWDDTYGMDAVCAVYHSGHGGMDANGVFYVPMGADWGNLGCTAVSSKMRLGNEKARYIYWSTCLSLRVLDGHSPTRTWGQVAGGVRMIFGFETVSWDSTDYGKFYWQEWNKNQSFSSAWLNASWRIAHDQAPSVCAFGANANEAQDRVFNERNYFCTPVSNAWCWWRWYNVASAAREANRSLPRALLHAQLRPVSAAMLSPQAIIDRFGLDIQAPAMAGAPGNGSFAIQEGARSIAQDATGAIRVVLARPNLDNTTAIPLGQARRTAEDAVRRFALNTGTSLVFDRTILASAAGGTNEGSGQLQASRLTETILQFRQVINGIPVVSPSAGVVRVGIDNDGRLTEIQSSIRQVEDLTGKARSTAPHPPEPSMTEEAPTSQGPSVSQDYEELLKAEFGRKMRSFACQGSVPVGFDTVPGSTEVGYDIQGDVAQLVARKAVEVDFGMGYKKRYWVQVPLFG
jgi:hypothetical protein